MNEQTEYTEEEYAVSKQEQIDILVRCNHELDEQLSEADAREATLIERLIVTEKALLEHVVYPQVTLG